MQSGKAPTIQTDPSAKRTAKANRVVNVSKRGSIAIPRKLIEELGLKIGETFAVRPSKAGLSLRKIVQSRDIVDNPDGS